MASNTFKNGEESLKPHADVMTASSLCRLCHNPNVGSQMNKFIQGSVLMSHNTNLPISNATTISMLFSLSSIDMPQAVFLEVDKRRTVRKDRSKD